MTRVCGWILLALSVGSRLAAAEDVIYKCTRDGGTVTFSDKPCAEPRDMRQITIEPPPLPDITDIRPLCASEMGARLDIKSLDRKTLAAMSGVQRASTQDALAEYARAGSRAGARWGRDERQAVHLCLPTFADEIVEYVATTDGKLVQMRAGMVSYLNDPDTPRALLHRCVEQLLGSRAWQPTARRWKFEVNGAPGVTLAPAGWLQHLVENLVSAIVPFFQAGDAVGMG